MHPVDRHTHACAESRTETLARYGAANWPTAPGTPAHDFWLRSYDRHLRGPRP